MNDEKAGKKAPQEPAKARRPYRKPAVETRPLFERMALTCDKFPAEGDPTPS